MGNELIKSLSELEAMADAMLKSGGGEPLSAGDISGDTPPAEGEKGNSGSGSASSNTGQGDGKGEGDELKDGGEVSKALQENGFLSQKFEEINASVNLLKGVVEKSVTTQDDTMAVFAKSFTAIAQTQSLMADMMKSIGGEVTELNSRMGAIESQPQIRKSISNINVLDKNFPKSAGQPGEVLNKSQIAAILSDELFKGNPNVTKQDIIRIESGVPLRNELWPLINNRTNQ